MDQKMMYTREMYMLQTKLAIQDKKKKKIESHLRTAEKALDELQKTTEKEVYKIVGNILIKKKVNEVTIELREKKEKMEIELSEIETLLENDLAKFKEYGAKYAIHENMQAGDYTLDSGRSIFNVSDFNNESE